MTAKKLEKKYGTWGEHPEYVRSDWKYEVTNGDTSLGYWVWVENQIDMNDD